jgi:hypothetical protein
MIARTHGGFPPLILLPWQLASCLILISLFACQVPADGASEAQISVPVISLPGTAIADSVEWGELVYYDVSDDGDVVGMDRYNSQLVYISRTTGDVTRIGRRGEGPGEINVGGIVALAGDRIVLSERGRLSTFNRAGEFLGSIPFRRATEIARWDSSSVVLKIPTRSETGLPETYQLHWLSLQRLEVSEPFFSTTTPKDSPESLSCATCEIVRVGDRLVTTLIGGTGRFASLASNGSDVTFFEGSGRSPVPFSAKEWEEYMTTARSHANYLFAGRGFDVRLDVTREVGTPGFPKPLLATDGSIGGTPDGSVWLLAGVADSERTQIDVFGPDGTWKFVVRIDERLDRISINGRWLVGLAYDDLGRPELFRYDLDGMS